MRRALSVRSEMAGVGEAAPLSAGDIEAGAAAQALAAIADVMLLLNRDGLVRAVGFGADRKLAGLLSTPRRRWIDLLAPDSAAKGRAMLAEVDFTPDAPPAPLRLREVNHLGASGGGPVPLRVAAIRHGDDILIVGQSLLPQAELQRQLIDVQQAMERDYARLRGVEARYRLLFQRAGAPMLIVDAATRKILEANAACPPAFGLSAARLSGRSLASLFDEHDGPALDALVAAAIGAGEARGVTLRAAAGETRFEVGAHLFRQDGGSLLLLQARPEGEAAAVDHAAALPSLLERLPEGFVVTDGDGIVIEANRAFLDLAGLPTAGAAAGRGLGEWLGRSSADFGALLSSVAKHGSLRGVPTLVRDGYGSQEPVEVSAVSLIERATPRIGFLVRTERRPRPPGASGLPRSVEQMKELVGNVPLRDLVRETTDVIERLCIEAALELAGDNRASAAEMLGLSRQSLYAKLHRFGLGDLGSDASGGDPAS